MSDVYLGRHETENSSILPTSFIMASAPLVLVTGGTGFLAIWTIVHLFRQGYRVRTTVRKLARVNEIQACLRAANISEDQILSLEVVEADLLKDSGWAEAVHGVTYILHLASPFPAQLPKNEADLINPARDGTLRVLCAARDARSVDRVVMTSSFAAVGYGHSQDRFKSDSIPFTETDWTDLSSGTVPPYQKSKTLAELAAWEFMKTECNGSKLELAVINPVSIYGPALGKDDGTSLRAICELLQGTTPGVPRLCYGIVDVRDCADMHLRAMTDPGARNERFLCIGEGSLWMEDLAKILKKNLGSQAKKVPTMVMPNLLVRGLAVFLPIARLILYDLDHEKKISNAKAKEILGWQWQYTNEQAVVASAISIIKYGIVKV
jgi:dihydroflavonol-4-reductase